MKFATLKSKENRDGILCMVSPDHKTAVKVDTIVPHLRVALENWSRYQVQFEKIDQDLKAGKAANSFPVKIEDLHSVLPRTWLFADGSAFIHHIKLVRMARNAPLPETLKRCLSCIRLNVGSF